MGRSSSESVVIWPVMLSRTALRRVMDLPCSVLGPVDFFALARLASICFWEVMVMIPFVDDSTIRR